MLASLEPFWFGERAQDTIFCFHCEPRDLFTHFEVSLRPIVQQTHNQVARHTCFARELFSRWHDLTI